MQIDFLYQQDLFVIVLVLALLLIVSALIGKAIRRMVKSHFSLESESQSSFVPTTILGLLALVLGFTFSMSVARYVRRNIVIQEANAIGTSLLRAQLLPKEFGLPIQKLLQEYLKIRIEFHNIRTDSAKKKQILTRTDELQQNIWKIIMHAVEKNRDPITALNVSAMNEVFDIGSERHYSTASRIPELVYLILFLVGSIGIGTLGFLEGGRKGSLFNVCVLSVLFALVIGLVLDIDRPQRGLIQISQDPLIKVLSDLDHPNQ